MAKSGNKQNLIERFAPNCGVMGFLMVIGCFSDIFFTYHFKWQAWEFGMVFTGILVPAKAAKIADARWGRK